MIYISFSKPLTTELQNKTTSKTKKKHYIVMPVEEKEDQQQLRPVRTSKEVFKPKVHHSDDVIVSDDKMHDQQSDDIQSSPSAKVPAEKEVDAKPLEDPTHSNKKQTFIVRTIWTFVMIFGFFVILGSGHIWCIALIIFCQITTFKECIGITHLSSQERNLPLTRTLNWYFLFTTIYYLDGLSIAQFFTKYYIKFPILNWLTLNHIFISYCLYVLGFVLFVSSLKKGFLRFQFSSLCVTHMVLLLVVFQAHLIIQNVINGLFWFLLPCGLVIVNDIFAYLCGITFGKTKLISISPKKTLEGFLGAWFFTVLASLILTKLLAGAKYMTCPVSDLKTNVFTHLACETNPVFIPQRMKLPPIKIFENLNIQSITFKPIYLHAVVLATFASLIAPFGGFFASGLKRAVKVKDFGQSIPGHGGITDRVDCQFMMGSFTYLYYETFISEKRITVFTILSSIIMNLNERQILQLIRELNLLLYANQIITQETFEKLAALYP